MSLLLQILLKHTLPIDQCKIQGAIIWTLIKILKIPKFDELILFDTYFKIVPFKIYLFGAKCGCYTLITLKRVLPIIL